jgi:hypothetical protein
MHCGVDSQRVIWILLVVLTVVGGVAAVGVATNERRKALGGGGAGQKQLTTGDGDKLLERTVRDLRVGDVLTIDSKDFICEGAILYDEDGHRWVGGRCVDGADIKWVIVGIDRTGTSATRLLTQDESTPVTGYPPEAIVVGDVRYSLDKRGTATRRSKLEDRHKRELCRLRMDELRFGLAVLEGAYRDGLRGGAPARGCVAAITAIDAAARELLRNPTEALFLQALFLRLSACDAGLAA